MTARGRSAVAWAAAVGFALVGACASSQKTGAVQPEELSAAGHRQEAANERARAEDAFARYQPSARASMPGGPVGTTDAPRLYPLDLYPYNPTDRALADAERHLRHAREHEAAATALEGFEEAECREFSPKARAACPVLGPVAAITDRGNGVHVTFADGANVEATVAHMRCHLAFARARGWQDAGDCPLYVRGVEIAASPDGRGVDITSGDAVVAHDIQVRSRLVSSPVPGR